MELDGAKIKLGGRFHVMGQDAYKARLKARGASVVKKLGPTAEVFVAGERVKPAMLAQAKALGLEIWDEAQLAAAVGVLEPEARERSLRERLEGAQPSKEAWAELVRALDTEWPDEDEARGRAVEIAEPLLSGWPDGLRVAPRHWLLGSGPCYARDPRFRLARRATPAHAEGGHLVVVAEAPTRDATEAWLDARAGDPGLSPHWREILFGPSPIHGQRILERVRGRELRVVEGRNIGPSVESLPPQDPKLQNESFFFSRCGRYVWLADHDAEGSGQLRLLNAESMAQLGETHRVEHSWAELSVHRCLHGEDELVAFNRNAGDSHLGVTLAEIKGGELHVRDAICKGPDSLELTGFSEDRTRLVATDGYNLLSIWNTATGEPVYSGYPDLTGFPGLPSEAPRLSFGGYVGRCALIPLEDEPSFGWGGFAGVALIDPADGSLLGLCRASDGHPEEVYPEFVGPGLVLMRDAFWRYMRVLRFLPSVLDQ